MWDFPRWFLFHWHWQHIFAWKMSHFKTSQCEWNLYNYYYQQTISAKTLLGPWFKFSSCSPYQKKKHPNIVWKISSNLTHSNSKSLLRKEILFQNAVLTQSAEVLKLKESDNEVSGKAVTIVRKEKNRSPPPSSLAASMTPWYEDQSL